MIDLTGKRFGSLTVLYKLDKTVYGTHYWRCRCDCGVEKDILGSNLRQGKSTSCGCQRSLINSQIHRKDITNRRFGKLTALYPTDKRSSSFIVWHCRCDCGNEKDVSINHLLNGDTSSCGNCGYAAELSRLKMTRWKTPEEKAIAKAFNRMHSRCYNPNEKSYPDYGGRGITICDEWLEDRAKFVEWSLKNGYGPGLSPDRFPDNDGPYAPWNCRWATEEEQANNKRSTHIVTVHNVSMSLAEWSRALGIPYYSLANPSKKYGDKGVEEVILKHLS